MSPTFRKLALLTGIVISAIALPVVVAAAQFNDDYDYHATFDETVSLLDTGVVVLDNPNRDFDGLTWFRINVNTRTELEIDQDAVMKFDNLGNVPMDGSRNVLTAIKEKNAGNGAEFKVRTRPSITVDVAYDRFGERCSPGFISTPAELSAATAAGTCLDIAAHVGPFDVAELPILRDNGKLPFAGAIVERDRLKGPTIVDLGALIGLAPEFLLVTLDLETDLRIAATTGFVAERQISPASSPSTVLESKSIKWFHDNSSVVDTIQPQCTWPVNENLIYRLRSLKWEGTATVEAAPAISLRLHPAGIPRGIVLFSRELPLARTLLDQEISIPGGNLAHTLGRVTPDNQPPTIAVDGVSGFEGFPVLLNVRGTGVGGRLDNCANETLSITWNFGDGTAGSGRFVSHVYNDNGLYNGSVTVTDPSGNSRTRTFSATISNRPPSATLSVESEPIGNGGILAHLTLSGADDPSPIDLQSGFTYRFDCGTGFGAPIAGNSASCVVTPGTTVRARIIDKDGGASTYASVVEGPPVGLRVLIQGTGDGVVTGPGVSCTPDCAETYAFGTLVHLSAVPSVGSSFDHWVGCSPVPGDPATCVVAMDEFTTVEAFFELPQPQNLRVVLRGSGQGTVTGPGISCSPDCAETYPSGTLVTVHAQSSPGSSFSHWEGCAADPDDVATCSVTMDRAQVVEAHFDLAPTLTVLLRDPAEGSVVGPGIECETDCSESFPGGTVVTLTARPAEGFAAAAWEGCLPRGLSPETCVVVVDGDVTVTPLFVPQG